MTVESGSLKNFKIGEESLIDCAVFRIASKIEAPENSYQLRDFSPLNVEGCNPWCRTLS
jgi:hypothetical protein